MYLKSLLEYKKSFIMSFISQFFVFFTYYFIIIALFDKFDTVKGYTKYEVLLCFGIIQFGFSLVEIFGRGIDRFDNLIIRGEFDRLLLRPKNILLQVLCTDFDLIKIPRMLQSIIILIISLVKLKINLSFYKIITLILMLLSSVVIFFSIFVLIVFLRLWIVFTLVILNSFFGRLPIYTPLSCFSGVLSCYFIWDIILCIFILSNFFVLEAAGS